MNPARLVGEFERRWESAGRTSHPRLLRLALLRELSRRIHAGRSAVLAGPASAPPEALRALHALEAQAERLRDQASLEGTLAHCLATAPKPAAKGPTPGPLPFVPALDPAKLGRADRTWERAIAQEAQARGFSLAAIEALVPMKEVEDWSLGLETELWPAAVLLFTEAAPGPTEPGPRWRGRWWTCFAPDQDPAAWAARSRLVPPPEFAATEPGR